MTNTNDKTTEGGNEGGFWNDVAPMMRGVKPLEQSLSEAVRAREGKVMKQDIITSSEAALKKSDKQFAQDFHQKLQNEAAMVEATGKPLTTGGGGEYNPFKDPFRVGEFAQKEKMGAMLGEASALEKMTPTQRAFYNESRKGQGNIPSTSTNGDGHVDLTSNSDRNKAAYDEHTQGNQ